MLKSKEKMKLLDSSDSEAEEGDGTKLGLNTNYAERYEKWRGKEEMQKLKDRVGSMQEESDSESSSESENEWNPEEEKQFFKTLSCLKKKDPKIYDEKLTFFKGKSDQEQNGKPDSQASSSSKREAKKPFLLKDHERKMVLEHDGLDPSYEEPRSRRPIHESGSYYDELRNIKQDISAAVRNIDSDADDDNYDQSDLLTKRVKSGAEEEEEEEDYRKWLKGQLTKLDNPKSKDDENEMKFLKDYWNDPKLDDGEQFLRDYILNRKYVEGDKEYIPSYEEIVHDSDDGGLSGDEKRLEEMEKFENKYNFRFEEPDQEFIKKYPRTVSNSFRRTEAKRKTEREHLKERKKLEKEKKVSEIQRYKALKRKEILEKLEKLQEIAGKAELDFKEEDVEKDFDPEEHDRRMQQIFNDQYYCDEDADEKPVFDYDEEIDDVEDFNNWIGDPVEEQQEEEPSQEISSSKKKKKKKYKAEPDAFDCDADDIASQSNGKPESSSNSKGKKKSFFMQTMEKKKPTFDPSTHSSFLDYFDEYYKLDFEDLIGDIPCRFKYRKVVPNSFGLTTDEILKASDKELNQWVSVKKACQHRSAEEEKYDVQAYERKAKDAEKKKKILQSLYNEAASGEEEDHEPESKKKKRKKKKRKSKTTKSVDGGDTEVNESNETLLDAEDEGPPKKKRKSKNGPPESEGANVEQDAPAFLEPVVQDNTVEAKPKKKKKKKKSNGIGATADLAKQNGDQSKSIKPESNKTKKWKKQNNQTKGSKHGKVDDSVAADRLRAYGINPTKYAKRKKYTV